jgi:hypothetical protein
MVLQRQTIMIKVLSFCSVTPDEFWKKRSKMLKSPSSLYINHIVEEHNMQNVERFLDMNHISEHS